MSNPYLGEIRMFGGNFSPRGWAFCNGQLLSIAQNDALFALLGTTYGGDGQTTFALPDLRGRVPVHIGTGAGATYTQAQTGGAETVTLTTGQLPAHTHGAQGATTGAATSSPAGAVWLAWSSNQYTNQATPASLAAGAVGSAGGGQSHENRQPYLALNFIIALEGVFPSTN